MSDLTKGRKAMSTVDRIMNWTTYHKPDEHDRAAHERIKLAAREFMLSIESNTPASADQSASLRLAREAMMTASAAIACEGK